MMNTIAMLCSILYNFVKFQKLIRKANGLLNALFAKIPLEMGGTKASTLSIRQPCASISNLATKIHSFSCCFYYFHIFCGNHYLQTTKNIA